MFDFTGRNGTISWDQDGAFRRDTWYMDIVPGDLDIDLPGHASLDSSTDNSAPAYTLRIRSSGTLH